MYTHFQVGPNIATENHSSLNLSGFNDFPPQVSPNLRLCLQDCFAARGCSLVRISIGPCFPDQCDGLSKLCHSSRNSYFINQETWEDLILRGHSHISTSRPTAEHDTDITDAAVDEDRLYLVQWC